mgnify:FL=1
MSFEEAKQLVAGLSLEEKARLVSGDGPWHTADLTGKGIPPILMTDGPGGLRKQKDTGAAGDLTDSEVATCFPPATALASSWDPSLAERIGAAIGEEARHAGVAVVLGPGVNLKRSVRCGRNFEYYSEDPLLAGRMGGGWVYGIQSKGIGSSLKHFAANNQETERRRINVNVDPRTVQEMYLRAFRHVVRYESPWTLMCAYNSLRGEFCAQNHWLLTQVLRDDWGYDGLVMSDWGAVHDPVKSVQAGLDLEMPGTAGKSAAQLVAAVQSGELEEAALDLVATRVAQLVLRAKENGMTLPIPGDGEIPEELLEAHNAVATDAAAASIVLLENNGVLPLSPDMDPSDLVVIGAFAEQPRYQGAGSSQIVPWKLSDALSAIRKRVPGVHYEPGFRLDGEEDRDMEESAIRAAGLAKVAVVFLGLPAQEESEGFDREHIDLPENQLELLDQVMGVNDNVIVVLSNGGVVTVTPWAKQVAALLEGWLLGQGGGEATAQVLFGDVSPSGRLAESIPHRLEDTCAYINFPGEDRQVLYGERHFVGYRWYDELLLDVAYPFGHGLTYSTFEYSDLAIETDGNRVTVSFDVANTGDVDAAEVPQVYLSKPDSAFTRAPYELKAFAKVFLEPGETTRVDLVIGEDDMEFYSARAESWFIEGGKYQVSVGASVRDTKLTGEFEIPGNQPPVTLQTDDTLGDWMDNPVAGPYLMGMVTAMGISPEHPLFTFAKEMTVTQVADFIPDEGALQMLAALADAVNGGATLEMLQEQFG